MAKVKKNPAAVALGRLDGLKAGKARAAKLTAAGRSEKVPEPGGTETQLLVEVRGLILAARQTVARGVNAALVVLYWKVGHRIRKDVLKEKRAEYGEEILPTLSAKLVPEFGEGFSPRNLARMIALAEAFPEEPIVAALARQLGWSHFVELLPLKKHLQRDFYLRWLKKNEMRSGEEEPLGLILCAEKSDERIEVFELVARGIRVAEYLTELPPRKVLEAKLHDAVRAAHARLEGGSRK